MLGVFVVVVSVIGCSNFFAPSNAEDLPVLGVIGGNLAAPTQFPYQVALKVSKAHICGGALIARNIVLTAAHCTRDEPIFLLTVVAGTTNRITGGVSIRVKDVIENPQYNTRTDEYDLAVLFLLKKFKFGPKINAIKLPDVKETIPSGAIVTVSGWGVTSKGSDKSEYLKFASLPIWEKTKCYEFLKTRKAPLYCGGDESGNNNACPGDSGGPMAYNNKLFGVVSFGYKCGAPKRPVVYIDVAASRDWIKETTGI